MHTPKRKITLIVLTALYWVAAPFVVLFDFSEDKIWVMDPDKGFKAFPVERFLKIYRKWAHKKAQF
jgi:hypothetical protein